MAKPQLTRIMTLSVVALSGMWVGVMLAPRAESAVAQVTAWTGATPTPVVVVNELVPRAGVLQPGDLVHVTIYSLIEPGRGESFDLRVGEEGISLPLIEVLPVRGMTTDKAAQAIASELARINVMRDAVVTLTLTKTLAESKTRPGPFEVGDMVKVSVFDLTGHGTRTEVLAQLADDGTITLPLAGSIELKGMSEAQADRAIKLAYRERNVFQTPLLTTLKLGPDGRP